MPRWGYVALRRPGDRGLARMDSGLCSHRRGLGAAALLDGRFAASVLAVQAILALSTVMLVTRLMGLLRRAESANSSRPMRNSNGSHANAATLCTLPFIICDPR